MRNLLPLVWSVVGAAALSSGCVSGDEDFFFSDSSRVEPTQAADVVDSDSGAFSGGAMVFLDSGELRVDGQLYSDIVDFQLSENFQSQGRRCGTKEDHSAEVLQFTASDCSFKGTLIGDEYRPENGDVLQVQVVFHVIERSNGTGHISLDLVQSQIDILNEDYRAMAESPGRDGVDSRIEFVLASEDEAGNPTTGVDYQTNNSWFSDPGSGVSPMKSALGWDTNRYFNVYTNDANGALGYATFPSRTAGKVDDGVVLLWSSVGRDAPSGGVYNQGRTLTHESGHYFGLFHTFQGGCGDEESPYATGDLVADTTAHKSPNFQCTAAKSSCGGGNNPIANYMNYTNDSCMTSFTDEQSNRMRCSTLNYRPELFRVAEGSNSRPVAKFHAEVSEEGEVSLSDQSFDVDGNIVGWFWEFGDGSYSAEESPVHQYENTGTYRVVLLAQDNYGATSTASFELEVVVPGSDGGGNNGDQVTGLELGSEITDLIGDKGSELRFYLDVNETADLTFAMTGSGDADLYVRFDTEPTVDDWDYRSYENGSDESVEISDAQTGRYHILVRGYKAFEDVVLLANAN